jgi:hypothetical protein
VGGTFRGVLMPLFEIFPVISLYLQEAAWQRPAAATGKISFKP